MSFHHDAGRTYFSIRGFQDRLYSCRRRSYRFCKTCTDGGSEGVLLMMADSTNVLRQGYTSSERVVGRTLENIFRSSENRIIIATFFIECPQDTEDNRSGPCMQQESCYFRTQHGKCRRSGNGNGIYQGAGKHYSGPQ